jgi:hypothetical protein
MKKTLVHSICSLVITGLVCGSAMAENFGNDDFFAGDFDLKPERIDEFNEKYSIRISLALGDSASQKFQETLATKYAGYKIVGGCMGTFDRWGNTDIGVVLINPGHTTIMYATALESESYKKINPFSTVAMEAGEFGFSRRSPYIECFSWTHMGRSLHNSKRPGPRETAAYTKFRPKVPLDGLCVVTNSALDFECFGFDPKRRRLVPIGEIFND